MESTKSAGFGPFRYSPLSLFAAGFISVLVFQMGAIAVLHAIGAVPFTPFPYTATRPMGVPQIWSFAFWGGMRDRAVRIAQASSGFLYCVSITGITGARESIPEELLEQLAWLRTQTQLPLCVGFGISKPVHVQKLKDVADGVIVGSAIVRQLEQARARPAAEVIAQIGQYVQTLIEPLQ